MRNQERIPLIDELRGLSILLMVIYHAAVDISNELGALGWLLYSAPIHTLQVIFASVFILISGASTQFSKNNLKRGIKIFAFGMIISLITYLYNPDYFIKFGILHFLGIAAILYVCLGKIKIHPLIVILLFVVSYVLLSQNYNIPHLWILGITEPSFSSSDYFPIFPWIFVYVLGIHVGRKLKEEQGAPFIYQSHSKFLAQAGKHTFLIYLMHQPILIAILYVITKIGLH